MALFPLNSYSQGGKKDKTIEVTMKVVGKDGAAIPGASVVIGEGLLHATTDINGEFTFKAKPSSAVTVTMIGYNKYMGFVAPLAENNQIVLDEADFMKSNDDIVNLPFGNTIFNRYTTDNVTTISGAELAKYPSSDLRNALVGLLPGLIITENDGQPGLNSEENTSNLDATEKVSEGVRGSKIVYIVDNLQIDIAEMPLDPDEIESVTLIKDPVNKALYGPAATNGVVLIKTKRGSANERRINVNLEAGVSKVDRFPEFVTGVDYANLNNQAREASGLLPLYDETAIGEYQKNDPNSMLYPNNNFRDMLFKDTRSYQRANVSSYGGNDKIQYSAYVGYTGEGDIYKVGKTADYNRINVRSNLDVKLNDFMKMRFDFAGNLSLRRSPNYNNAASSEVTNINEFPAVIEHANTISPIAFPVYTGIDPETGSMGYGISSNFKYNPLGGLEGNGYYTDMNRSGMGSIALDIDLGRVLKGLTSTTFVSFNGSYMTRIGKNEEYAAFRVVPDETAEEGYKTIKDRPEELASGESLLHEYNNTRYSFYERLAYDREFGKNYIKAGATFHMSQLTRTGYPEPQRQANAIFDATYAFDNKYIVQASLDYAGANNYAKKNRYKVFPSGGLAWIVSDENFMENVDFIDYLKVRGQAARLGAMYFTQNYRYESDWNSPAGNDFWLSGW